MSGHSKWANIKNRKGAQDKKRGETFTKVSKNILTAIRLGGGSSDPEVNLQLKAAIEKAKEVNMPKENIQRLLDRFEERKGNLTTVILEGYGPFGVPMIIETETDNKNRILSEIKLIFRNFDGALGETNSVMYQFERVGEVDFESLDEEMGLSLIDMGAIDLDGNTVIVEANGLNDFVNKVKNIGLEPKRYELVYRSRSPIKLASEEEVNKILDLVDELEANDDVVGVWSGFEYN
jgi:YebC/PmpR family DNA-binding regulatory protein